MGNDEKVKVPEDLQELYDHFKNMITPGSRNIPDDFVELIGRIASLTAHLTEAKAGWDSCIADLREAAEICRDAEQERDRLREQLEKATAERDEQRIRAEIAEKGINDSRIDLKGFSQETIEELTGGARRAEAGKDGV